MSNRLLLTATAFAVATGLALAAEATRPPDSTPWWKPYSAPCVERENVFEFTEKPAVKKAAQDLYEITFAVKGYCDVTVGIVDSSRDLSGLGRGTVVRHLASGVLGPNAPAPLQKNSLKQTIYWNGKDDLDTYVKEPGKLQVRVMLGLKPEFDKLLGDGGPRSIPGYIWGLACEPAGVYVFYKGPGSHGHVGLKKFDREGRYVATLVPPAANLPEEKLGGWSYIEYEPGQKAVQGVDGHDSFARDGYMLLEINGKRTADCQPAVSNGRIFFGSAGSSVAGIGPSLLFWVHTDGSTDEEGLRGVPLLAPGASHPFPRFAAAPDGRTLYMLPFGMGDHQGSIGQGATAVFQRATSGKEPGRVFVGDPKRPGSDNQSLNSPMGVDCDAAGRVYVCDHANNRVQVFAPDGKHVKTIPLDRPFLVRVHATTGAIYAVHKARVEGQTIGRVTKLKTLDDPKEEFHVDHLTAAAFALDSWSARPRLWMAGDISSVNTAGAGGRGPGVRVWEDEGQTLRKIMDFDEDAKNTAAANYIGNFSAASPGPGGKVLCDPTREEVYWDHSMLFDLVSGAFKGRVKIPGIFDDMAIDRQGHLHVHLNPGFDHQGVVRYDPGQRTLQKDSGAFVYAELPYDYGVEIPGHYSAPRAGVLPVKDQPGAKFFQDGIGVNMRGDVVVDTNIYYVPKFEDQTKEAAVSATGLKDMEARHEYNSSIGEKYAQFNRQLQDWAKRGEEIFAIPRRPGLPATGATLWTFDRSGELRGKCAAVIGLHIAGVQMDEEGRLYFVTARPRQVAGRPFLEGRAGVFGLGPGKSDAVPFTGSLVKNRGTNLVLLSKGTIVPLEEPPARPYDVAGGWIEGTSWIYAGASPIVAGGCSCPTMRPHLDWYKRTFLSEAYRHSIGVVDASGNLILHVGRYGNYDSWQGSKSGIRVGGDEIGLFLPRMISGTDNYLCFQDYGERLVVLKLNYHTEETTPVKTE